LPPAVAMIDLSNVPPGVVTRFAPSLTGYLHLGHVLHMIYVWGIARARGGRVVSRIEDHDLSRARPEFERAILADMEWLGFVPDAGISSGNASSPSPFRQSDCSDHYTAALEELVKQGLVYGCACSRKQILQAMNGGTPSSAFADSEDAVPSTQFNELCYSGTCLEKGLPIEGHTVRFRTHAGAVAFNDLALGNCHQVPAGQCGDFSLRDRNGQWTYQFCCVCDDIRQGVDLVIRGEDIHSSTGRQIMLFEALGSEPPHYLHHGLICDERGEKLSKRQRSESITELREAGAAPAEILGRAAYEGGLISEYRPLDITETLCLIG